MEEAEQLTIQFPNNSLWRRVRPSKTLCRAHCGYWLNDIWRSDPQIEVPQRNVASRLDSSQECFDPDGPHKRNEVVTRLGWRMYEILSERNASFRDLSEFQL